MPWRGSQIAPRVLQLHWKCRTESLHSPDTREVRGSLEQLGSIAVRLQVQRHHTLKNMLVSGNDVFTYFIDFFTQNIASVSYPNYLNIGQKVAAVFLSSGLIGQSGQIAAGSAFLLNCCLNSDRRTPAICRRHRAIGTLAKLMLMPSFLKRRSSFSLAMVSCF